MGVARNCVRLRFKGQIKSLPPHPSPLPQGGRGGKGADLHEFQNLGSTRYRKSVYLLHAPRSVFLPSGGRGADRCAFQNLSSTRYRTSVYLLHVSRSVFLPSGEGSRSLCFSKPEFDSVSQVGVPLTFTSISPLSLRERARVRGSCSCPRWSFTT